MDEGKTTVVGVYEDVNQAERARWQLIHAGVAPHRIELTANLDERTAAKSTPGEQPR